MTTQSTFVKIGKIGVPNMPLATDLPNTTTEIITLPDIAGAVNPKAISTVTF